MCDPRKSFFEKGSFWITCRHSCQRDRSTERSVRNVSGTGRYVECLCEVTRASLADDVSLYFGTELFRLWSCQTAYTLREIQFVLYRWTVFHPRPHCEVIYSDTDFQLFAVRRVWALLPVAIHPLFCTTSNVTTVNICIYAERRPHQELFVNACNFGSLMEFTKNSVIFSTGM
jgi:hypothetical protein